MDVVQRIEAALNAAVAQTQVPGGPPKLAAAIRHAVFPGGARIRPRLCLAVAAACAEDDPAATDAAAAAIEFLHCASLVHDDLPCFDDADTRRGKPSVHRAFGQPLAVLTGDALIVLAFQTLARGLVASPLRLPPLLTVIASSVGAPYGIVAGQAWESEPHINLAEYQRAKTGSLFAAATVAGAVAAGAEPEAWRLVGELLGEAYQVADDIGDAASNPDALGKPIGRDQALGRPSAALQLGLPGAILRLEELTAGAADAVPPCAGAPQLQKLIRHEAQRLLPRELARSDA